MVQKISVEETGGAWNGANIKRDARTAAKNKVVRIFIAMVVIGLLVKYLA